MLNRILYYPKIEKVGRIDKKMDLFNFFHCRDASHLIESW